MTPIGEEAHNQGAVQQKEKNKQIKIKISIQKKIHIIIHTIFYSVGIKDINIYNTLLVQIINININKYFIISSHDVRDVIHFNLISLYLKKKRHCHRFLLKHKYSFNN